MMKIVILNAGRVCLQKKFKKRCEREKKAAQRPIMLFVEKLT